MDLNQSFLICVTLGMSTNFSECQYFVFVPVLFHSVINKHLLNIYL